MKIAILASSLEPGCDGVGDYTRRLSSELIRQGHLTFAVALNEQHISKPLLEVQEAGGIPVSTLRFPGLLPWPERIAKTNDALGVIGPDWLSLQFVPFGFHPKGLCFGLGKSLSRLNKTAAWHVMFHELWLGLGRNASLKHRLWGAIQRLITVDLVRHLSPKIVHTQTDLYRTALNKERIQASILPIFSNISLNEGDGWSGLLEPMISDELGAPADRDELYLAGVFGSVHAEWSIDEAVTTILPSVHRARKKLILVFLGKSNLSPGAISTLRTALRDRASLVMAGERSSREVSKILQAVDLGLATSPRVLIEKSGSVAAMLEHGLKVLVTREEQCGTEPSTAAAISALLSPSQFSSLAVLPTRDPECYEAPGVKRVASQMLGEMQRAA